MRTKYLFSSRAGAEDAFRVIEKQQMELHRALNAKCRREVFYLPMLGPYKVGLYWLEKGNGHVLVEQPRSGGASVIVMDCEDFFTWTNGEAGHLDENLRRCAFYVRRVRTAVWNGMNIVDAIDVEKLAIREDK